MKALSLWQPWATLLCAGIKIYETRSWQTRYRGPIALHAARLPVERALRETPPEKVLAMRRALAPVSFSQLPTGCILGVAELAGCLPVDEAFAAALPGDERYFGDFSPGRFAWVLQNVQMLPQPIPARGWQGLWNYAGALPLTEKKGG